MVALALLLIVLALIAVLAGLVLTDLDGSTLQVATIDVAPTTLFLIGLGAGAALVIGAWLLKIGTKRDLRRRHDRRRINKLEKKLDQTQSQSQTPASGQPGPAAGPPTADPAPPPASTEDR